MHAVINYYERTIIHYECFHNALVVLLYGKVKLIFSGFQAEITLQLHWFILWNYSGLRSYKIRLPSTFCEMMNFTIASNSSDLNTYKGENVRHLVWRRGLLPLAFSPSPSRTPSLAISSIWQQHPLLRSKASPSSSSASPASHILTVGVFLCLHGGHCSSCSPSKWATPLTWWGTGSDEAWISKPCWRGTGFWSPRFYQCYSVCLRSFLADAIVFAICMSIPPCLFQHSVLIPAAVTVQINQPVLHQLYLPKSKRRISRAHIFLLHYYVSLKKKKKWRLSGEWGVVEDIASVPHLCLEVSKPNVTRLKGQVMTARSGSQRARFIHELNISFIVF